jgi:endonuclease-3
MENDNAALSRRSPRKRFKTDVQDPAMSSSSVLVAMPVKVESSSSVMLAMPVKVESSTKDKTALVQTSRPTPDECWYATTELAKLHPEVVDRNEERRRTLLESCGMRNSVLDAVVSTMLSQNTTDANSKAAYASLQKTFGKDDWHTAVAQFENISKLEAAIRVAGLAKTRAERIQRMLQTLMEEQQGDKDAPSLEYLHKLSNEEIKTELSRFKGLGPKTISCVLLFGLARENEFPVDTHVWRITQKMGWLPNAAASSSREGAYQHLNATIPNDVKLDLHCLLVLHGKVCHSCAAKGRPQFPPADGSRLSCPLKNVPTHVKKRSLLEIKGEDAVLSQRSVSVKAEQDIKCSIPVAVKKEEDIR